MKKDLVLSIVRILIWLSLLSYIIYLFINKADIIPSQTRNYDATIYCIIWFFAIAITVSWIIKPCIKKQRTIMVIMWITIILFANYVWLKDNPSSYIFLRDVLNVLWTIITILWFTKVCIYDKCQKKQEEAEIEIIEV